ncbi:MAG: class I SAM-dependent methyltransferase [Candidatus Hydrogenedentes bacterium]|nr:class I SAM-dependent methyltransferase [Candidatus Hydrogenedentota bacterium]
MSHTIRKFDEEAASWDDKPHRHKLATDIGNALQMAVTFSENMHILDFGCGTGLVALQLAGKVGKITGADSSRGMLEVFREKAKRAALDNVNTLHLGSEERMVSSDRYDVIVSSMTLHHIRNVEQLLRDFHQLLRPGGILSLADLDSDDGQFHQDKAGVFHQSFDRGQLKCMLADAGFSSMVDCTAGQVTRPVADTGAMRTFTVFLITACRV